MSIEKHDSKDAAVMDDAYPNYHPTLLLRAAVPPRLAESLGLSGQFRTFRFPPRRLEGSASQPARRSRFWANVARKGGPFPQIRRQSRWPTLTAMSIIRSGLRLQVPSARGGVGSCIQKLSGVLFWAAGK